jgi:hypothetical protein
MNRFTALSVVFLLLFAPTLGSANPNGVGEGTFDAQCGGACHGDADMNKSSTSVVSVEAPSTAYEGLLTSVSITVEQIETTQTGLLGIFLLSSMNGAGDTPSDQGWDIVSNSEGGSENYVEVTVNPGQTKRTVTWTLRAPSMGTYALHGAIHHGGQDGSDAPFFGASNTPASVEVQEVPENLPRLDEAFNPPVERSVGDSTTVELTTQFVESLRVEWRVVGGEPQEAPVTANGGGAWSFDLPPSLQPSVIEWRAHLSGEGPEQTTPWFQLKSEEPRWSVDETTAYVQSIAMLLAFMAGFMALQHRTSPSSKAYEDDMFEEGGEA